MFFNKNVSKVWVFLLGLLLLYLFYQMFFGWDNNGDIKGDNSEIPDNKTAFIVIEENNFPSKKSNLKPLLEDLIVWDYNKKTEELYLKFDTLLPKNNSKVMIIYDRGFESFESHADVFAVNTFPYKYYFKETPLITIHDADSDGTVYLDFEGTRVKLSPGSTYRTGGLDGFKLNNIKIHNYGLLDKNNFKSDYLPKDLYNDLIYRLGDLTDKEKSELVKFTEDKLKDNTILSMQEREKIIVDSYNLLYEKFIK